MEHPCQIRFRTTTEVRATLDRIAEDSGISVSEQCRRAIRLWLEHMAEAYARANRRTAKHRNN
jgi:hypothetical protein